MSSEELQRVLDEDRSWRKQELTHARGLAESHRERPEEPYLCRSWTLMIYAHCDQYVKLATRAYLRHIELFPRSSYNARPLWLAFRGKVAMLEGSDESYRTCRDPSLLTLSDALGIASSKEAIDQANFKYKQLRFLVDWVLQIDFKHQEYKGFCTTLKTKRDQIAHGERVYVKTVEDCLPWHDPAIRLIDELTESIVETIGK